MHKSPRGRRARGGSRSDVWPCGVESITGYHKAVILPRFGREPGQLNYLLKTVTPPQLPEPHEEGVVGGEGCRAPFRTFPPSRRPQPVAEGPGRPAFKGGDVPLDRCVPFCKTLPFERPPHTSDTQQHRRAPCSGRIRNPPWHTGRHRGERGTGFRDSPCSFGFFSFSQIFHFLVGLLEHAASRPSAERRLCLPWGPRGSPSTLRAQGGCAELGFTLPPAPRCPCGE